MTPNKKPKVLVYLFGSLGDTIVAIPALRAVRRHFGNAELILLQNVESGNIVKASEVIPEDLIDGYLNYNNKADKFSKIGGFYRLWRDLRGHQFQTVVYLVISERPARSVARDKLFFRLCGIPHLLGFHAFSREELYPVDALKRPAMTDNEAVRKLKRLEMDGIKLLPEEDLRTPLLTFSTAEIENIKNWLAPRRKKFDSRLIAVAPGCKTRSNIWSLENFRQIGQRLIAADPNCEIIVIGGKAEREDGEKLVSAWGGGINAAGEFSVRESGALLSLCDFYIGLDTGTTHLAAVVGTTCFGIYGERNNPGNWFPLGTGHLVVFHPVVCAGCRAYTCPRPTHPCMTEISVEAVWQNLQKFMLQKTRTGADISAVERIAV
ncbi:MAG: glycosyltransferase family 9 protein [Acidobacteria bacterium]|nr:glycosyltransferase family 9 protein [Acidobacteriota bacterium]